jgi:hypothetical protein
VEAVDHRAELVERLGQVGRVIQVEQAQLVPDTAGVVEDRGAQVMREQAHPALLLA